MGKRRGSRTVVNGCRRARRAHATAYDVFFICKNMVCVHKPRLFLALLLPFTFCFLPGRNKEYSMNKFFSIQLLQEFVEIFNIIIQFRNGELQWVYAGVHIYIGDHENPDVASSICRHLHFDLIRTNKPASPKGVGRRAEGRGEANQIVFYKLRAPGPFVIALSNYIHC
ncbi:hypothetical protein EVAR_64915_1 [Eumeta japonica]|uniref:Uncharacterized protein n=1 Tax=Eumeta variegata TaxID=151549 RepID=A0A4C1ZMD4_EUMVA|nr:hypothetical protein EVAR_64915_1 [Eumeta japonica]